MQAISDARRRGQTRRRALMCSNDATANDAGIIIKSLVSEGFLKPHPSNCRSAVMDIKRGET